MTDSVEPSKVLVGVLQGWFDDVRPQVHGLSFHMLQNDGCIFQPRIVHDLNHELFFPCMLACHAARAFGRGRADNLIRQPFCSSRHLRFAHLCPTMTHQWEGPQWRKTWQQEEQHFNSRQWSLHKLEIDFEEKSVTEVWRKMRPGDRHDMAMEMEKEKVEENMEEKVEEKVEEMIMMVEKRRPRRSLRR